MTKRNKLYSIYWLDCTYFSLYQTTLSVKNTFDTWW